MLDAPRCLSMNDWGLQAGTRSQIAVSDVAEHE
jgi:hypothetical protein